MLISLSEIMTTKDKIKNYKVPIEIDKFNYQGVSYDISKKDPVEIIATNLGDKKVLIEGSTSISLGLFCGRCLKEIDYPLEIEFSKEVDFKLSEEERVQNLDEMNYIAGYNLDVDILINEEILIGFPMKLLCHEDCKGICKTCGTNLNKRTCDCDNTEYDPRMARIRDIFNNLKEV
ncbi:MAG: DUF177 domain-containing protein [Clostridiales bacterium]|jgi:uncharacterized protein|nr:DUF177 domain-containing protein [Clostridiales bacterium]